MAHPQNRGVNCEVDSAHSPPFKTLANHQLIDRRLDSRVQTNTRPIVWKIKARGGGSFDCRVTEGV